MATFSGQRGPPPQSAVAAVLGEEQLLQGRLAAHEAGDAGGGQDLQQRFDRPLTWQRTTGPSASTEVTPGTRDRSGIATVESRFHGQRAEMPHLGQRPHLDRASRRGGCPPGRRAPPPRS